MADRGTADATDEALEGAGFEATDERVTEDGREGGEQDGESEQGTPAGQYLSLAETMGPYATGRAIAAVDEQPSSTMSWCGAAIREVKWRRWWRGRD